MKKRRSRTFAEVRAERAKDPKYLARIKERDDRIRALAEQDARAEVPLVEALRGAGANVSSVWDLVNAKSRYSELVPVLLVHLDRDYPDRVREGIARALAVREARIGWDKLVRSYVNENGPLNPGLGINEVKFALHIAIASAADVSVVDDLIRLAADRRNAGHRSLFVDALAAIDDPRARAALQEFKNSPDLADAYKTLAKRAKRRR